MKCLRGASAVQSLLDSNADTPLRVFAVWLPILPTDFTAPNTSVLARLRDARVRQFWDPDHAVAKAISRGGQGQPEPDCCDQGGILWDIAAVYTKGQRWDDGMPAAVVLNGPVADVTDTIDQALKAQVK